LREIEIESKECDMSLSSATGEYLYVLRPARADMLSGGPTPEEVRIIEAHWNYLVDLHEKGIVLHVGRTTIPDQHAFGLVVFKAESWDKAVAIMQGDPAIGLGVMSGEVFPFQVFLRDKQAATK